MKSTQKTKQSSMSLCLIIILYIIGFAILLYPVFSNWVNQYRQTVAVKEYDTALSHTSQHTNEIKQLLKEAEQYNQSLYQLGTQLDRYKGQGSQYDHLLHLKGTDVMGYINIPAIDVHLPIYHGTSDAVLQRGVGHLKGSSLPIGGVNTHVVLSGHRGLPSGGVLFSHLDKLKKGDIFSIHVLNRTLFYQVDAIKTVLPQQTDDLAIQPGRDLVTLVTCTPYGVNTHRLFVRGTRIAIAEYIKSNVTKWSTHQVLMVVAILLLSMQFVMYVIYRCLCRRKEKVDNEQKETA